MPSPETASKTKPRLLIILNRFVIGGQAVDTIPLAYYLQQHFEIQILFGEKEKDEIEPRFLLDKYKGLSLRKLRFLRRSINPLIDIIAFISLVAAIRKFRPDIVHTHGAKSGFLGRFAAFVLRAPVIIHTFHGHFFHSYFSRFVSRFIAFVERSIGLITTCTVALSETQKQELVNDFKIIPFRKVKIIPLGFDIVEASDSLYQRAIFRDKYQLQSKHIAVGIVGRIVPVKNHIMFLKVIKKLQKSYAHIPFCFFIIGDGGLKVELENWLQQNDISFNSEGVNANNSIVFTSWITNVEEIMCGLDIVALTSFNEGTPLTLIESQFYKRPVVCTNVGGVKDTMIDQKTGFLLNVDEIEEFALKLVSLAENEDLRRKMGETGKEFVISHFNKLNEVAITKQFYLDLLSQNSNKHK